MSLWVNFIVSGRFNLFSFQTLHPIPRDFRGRRLKDIGRIGEFADFNDPHCDNDDPADSVVQETLLQDHPRLAHHVLPYAALPLQLLVLGVSWSYVFIFLK